MVVYLLIPTSNHNDDPCRGSEDDVVYLLIPTSNHNQAGGLPPSNCRCISFDSYIKPQRQTILRQTTERCISFDSYIKPQPTTCRRTRNTCCISFDSYIKPQLFCYCGFFYFVVYLLIPTSNHNGVDVADLVQCVVYLLIPTSNHNVDSIQATEGTLYIF